MQPSVHTLFASPRHARLAIVWLVGASIASAWTWWFGDADPGVPLALLMIACFPAAVSYNLTGHRRFLWMCALPVLLILLRAPPLASEVAYVLVATALPLVVGVLALTGLVRPEVMNARVSRLTSKGAYATIVAATLFAGRGRWAIESDAPASLELLASFAGCYAVERGVSFPPYRNPRTPPAFVVLDATSWTVDDGNKDPEHHISGPFYGRAKLIGTSGLPGYWTAIGARRVGVQWSSGGLGGFRAVLRREGDTLVGRGTWFQDLMTPFPLPTISLTLRRSRCSA